MSVTDEVKQRLDIVNVVSDYLSLQKAGRLYRALCPFHTEKTPSFFIFPERQSWRCFGCGAGGDLISFVMKKEGLGFGGALEMLAQRAGVAVSQKAKVSGKPNELDLLYRASEAAARYYHELLMVSAGAQVARDYLAGRSLSQQTIREFQLGYSPNEWGALKRNLTKDGYSEADLVLAGLLVKKADRSYDRFRGRLMFPIADAKGRIAGFGARSLDDSLPKYVNSAESPIFNKGAILYGFAHGQSAIREQGKAVIVEGYMDVITAHQNGFLNVVAPMGTALTDRQLAILKGLTNRLCLALDPDAAGDAATLRQIEACRQALDRSLPATPNWLGAPSQFQAEIDIMALPRGKDPDQLIREDPDAWQRLAGEAQPWMDHLFAAAAQRFDVTRPEGKSGLSEQLVPLIAEMKNSVDREAYLGRLSRMVGLSEKTLAGIAARLRRTQSEKSGKRKPAVLQGASATGDQLEERCLCLLLRHPELRERARDLSPDHFERSDNREVFAAWQSSPERQVIQGNLDSALHEHLDALASREMPPAHPPERLQELSLCIGRLEERRLRMRLIFEAESALESGASSAEGSMRLVELIDQRMTSGWR